jgi:hypothetical protein
MIPLCLDVHPVYGAIYKDGEFVQRGAVLGLSVDSKEVVVAPVSGWVRLVPRTNGTTVQNAPQSLQVEIWQRPLDANASSSYPETPN